MIVKNIEVKNYRSLKNASLDCENLTVLVGANGTGKSSFLRALQLFYDASVPYGEEDFYDRDTSQSISIAITFTELTEAEKALFKSHVQGQELTVMKELTWPVARGSQKYYGSTLQNPEFEGVRTISGASEKRKAYSQLISNGKYSELPHISRADEIEPGSVRRAARGAQYW